ncbi:MAG: 3-dehydroquinate synthase [bacterium]
MKLSARIVKTERYPVCLGEEAFVHLEKELARYRKSKSPVFILTDSNTLRFCLPVLTDRCPELRQAQVLTVEAGEDRKTLSSAEFLWNELARLQVNRQALLISLGGGMVTDLGGFVASGFHRGIDCIHVPTTLIGQIDAAIGGKTGVNLDSLKNQVGTYYSPRGVYCWPGFFATLGKDQLRSGLAEVTKTALIRDERFWRWLSRKPVEEILSIPFTENGWKEILLQTVRIKLEIVRQDPFERNRRKLLNFGHTVGHAMESLALRRGTPVLHGEAVAAGILCECFLSEQLAGLDPGQSTTIVNWLLKGFGKIGISSGDVPELLALMGHDKKNRNQELRFTLLSRPGQGKINQSCDPARIVGALTRYLELPSDIRP